MSVSRTAGTADRRRSSEQAQWGAGVVPSAVHLAAPGARGPVERAATDRTEAPGAAAAFVAVQQLPADRPLRVVAVTYSPGPALEGFVTSLLTATRRPVEVV